VDGLIVQRTSFQTLLNLSVISFAVTFGFARLFLETLNGLLPVNSGSPIALAILDLAIFAWTLSVSNRLPKLSKTDDAVVVKLSANPLPPLMAARTVAFALAGSRVGALLFGAYLGLAINATAEMQVVAFANHIKLSALSSLLGLIMVLICLWLERKCSPPRPTSTEE
jgi:hypothetical protein